jgi:transcriptional regulator with XRE-family HTH domain
MQQLMLAVLVREFGLSQVEVGRAAGVEEKRMSLICRRRVKPRPDERRALAGVLHLSEHDLFAEPPQVAAVFAALVAKRAASIAREMGEASAVNVPA